MRVVEADDLYKWREWFWFVVYGNVHFSILGFSSVVFGSFWGNMVLYLTVVVVKRPQDRSRVG